MAVLTPTAAIPSASQTAGMGAPASGAPARRTLTSEERRVYEEQGFVVVPDVIPAGELAALDGESATRLSRAPSAVRGRRPYIENVPHAASNTRALVYVANRTVYISRASPVPSPLVGWYRVGPLPV